MTWILTIALLAACGDDDGRTSADAAPGLDATGSDAGPGGDRDGGAGDAGTDAGPTDVDAATDVDAGADERWDHDAVAARYCEPLVAMVCDAAARCDCAADCDDAARAAARDACLMPFIEVLPRVAWFDGTRLLQLVAARRDYADACTRRPQPLVSQLVFASFIVPAEIGEPCAPDGHGCAEGAGVCASGICRTAPAIGESCATACAEPAICTGGTCVIPGAPGAACADDLGCEAPARCGEGTCRTLGTAGAACITSDECAPSHVCAGGACVASATCDATGSCGFGAGCASGPGTCEPLGVAGAACGSDAGCANGWVCATDATCVPGPGAGEPCSRGRRCGAGAWCDGGTCAALRDVGETCLAPLEGVDCGTGHCDAGTSVCAPPLADGSPCGSSGECDPASWCDRGTCAPRLTAGTACDAFAGACARGLGCVAGTCSDPTGSACESPPAGCDSEEHFCRPTGVCTCTL